MKPTTLFLIILCLPFVSCEPSPMPEAYRVQFSPSLSLRMELLGEPHWRLEYYDSKGNFCQKEVAKNEVANMALSLAQEWPGAILAWPYWPEKALAAGVFCPAGALFPLDISGDKIILSWEAGVEAYFYRELEKAQALNTGTNRMPAFFDWKRFRSLLRENSSEELRLDPWLADWKDIAEKTVRSGFRQSYVKTAARATINVIIPHNGPWLAASPFRLPQYWEENEEVSLLIPARPEIFVCPGGRLSVSENACIWVPY
jgi:hypothetical protein